MIHDDDGSSAFSCCSASICTLAPPTHIETMTPSSIVKELKKYRQNVSLVSSDAIAFHFKHRYHQQGRFPPVALVRRFHLLVSKEWNGMGATHCSFLITTTRDQYRQQQCSRLSACQIVLHSLKLTLIGSRETTWLVLYKNVMNYLERESLTRIFDSTCCHGMQLHDAFT